MKKILTMTAAVALFACGSDAADITLYYMPGCPHCHNAINFFDSELKGVSIEKINVTEGGKAAERFGAALKKCNLTSRGVPLMIVKGECIQGYAPEVGEQIKKILGK
jgi:glutaredoxin